MLLKIANYCLILIPDEETIDMEVDKGDSGPKAPHPSPASSPRGSFETVASAEDGLPTPPTPKFWTPPSFEDYTPSGSRSTGTRPKRPRASCRGAKGATGRDDTPSSDGSVSTKRAKLKSRIKDEEL